jgi:hypothetical protein
MGIPSELFVVSEATFQEFDSGNIDNASAYYHCEVTGIDQDHLDQLTEMAY